MFANTFVSLLAITGLASSAALPRRTLSPDDIIVWGKDGRVEVWNKTSYADLTSTHGSMFNLTSPPPLTHDTPFSNTTSKRSELTSNELTKRGCSSRTVWSLNPVSTFLNWDVIMSSVVKATADADASVAVTAGYSITNTLGVSASTSLTLVQDFLSVSYSIDYSESWSSSYSAGYTFTVPAGKYGAVVSNPLTTRHSGSVDVGCIGAAETTTFQSDSYSSKSYGDLSWVQGTISLCTSDTYPMPMCIGTGTLA